jgi:16S rRNA (uracil1498-N3)-methyltransferase
MGATRFFAPGILASGELVELGRDDAHKLLVVLRRGSGDAVQIVDSGGRSFAGILEIDGARVSARLLEEVASVRPPSLAITLAQGIPKGAKMDFVIEKATELGVSAVLPFTSERTVGDGGRDGKVERWRRLAKSAAEQCGRRDVPRVDAPSPFAALLKTFTRYDLVLVPWEIADAVPLRERLPGLLPGSATLLLAIGPEGGFSHAEALAAEAAGAQLISLGSRIFRTETAGLVACSALLYATGDL